MKLLKSLFVVGLSLFLLGGTTGSSVQALESTESAVKAAEMEKIKQLTEQIKLDPKKALLYAKRGQCYVRLKDWSNALADTNAAIDLESTVGRFYAARGSIYNAMGKHDLEKFDLERAVRIAPSDVQCLTKLAALYGVKGQYSEACNLLSKAISIMANSAELYILRAETFTSMRNFSKAIADCDQAEKLEPENKEISLVRNEIMRVKDYSSAQR